MDTAILHNHDCEDVISADEYYSRFGRQSPANSWLTCPECGQPVVARAMRRDSSVRPYFKHEDNNEIAQACELYSPGGGSTGYSSSYASSREDIDMYIEEEGPGSFSLSVAFPCINDKWAINFLEQQNASLWSGTYEYDFIGEIFEGDDYVLLSYGIEGDSFGPGIALSGEWPYDSPLPNIVPASNGCMLFELGNEDELSGRVGNGGRSVITSDTEYLLVYSSSTGIDAMRAIKDISSSFFDVGSIEGSSGKLQVAKFVLSEDSFRDPVRLHNSIWSAI